MPQGISESAVNVLDMVLELQQLLAGSATSFTEFVLCETGSATRFTEFILYEVESAVTLKAESTFDLLPHPVFCVVCSFMASLSYAMASPREGSGILFVGFLAEDSVPPMASRSFSDSTWSFSSKMFPQQCQGHSFGQSRIIIKSICLWVPRSVLTDS